MGKQSYHSWLHWESFNVINSGPVSVIEVYWPSELGEMFWSPSLGKFAAIRRNDNCFSEDSLRIKFCVRAIFCRQRGDILIFSGYYHIYR